MSSPLSSEKPDHLPSGCDRRRLINLARNLDDMVFVLDRSGCCLFFYTHVPELLFTSPEALLGKALTTVLPPELHPLKTALTQALATETQPAPMEYSSPDGKQRYRVFFEPIMGYEDYLVAQIRNITEHYFARRLLLGFTPEHRPDFERHSRQ